ncbi:MAG: cyclic nucleotide-binding domain-containing protein [Candidatus Tectimicrobiota bacterium]
MSQALAGLWLHPEPVHAPIEPLFLEMLVSTHPDPALRHAVVEELQRPSKLKDVVLRALSLVECCRDESSTCPLWLVTPEQALSHPWSQALLRHSQECPIGFVVHTYDHGTIALVHDVFTQLMPEQQQLIRRYAALAVRGWSQPKILAALNRALGSKERVQALLQETRRRVHILTPSVLFSLDGGLRIELGSLSQTTKNLLREGLAGENLFILPKHLFEGRTNYADVEFLVYLNFFVRSGARTRIAGTNNQRLMLERLLRLTIFGLFDPRRDEQPSFLTLRDRYGLPDEDTYQLFHMLYNNYGVRGASCCGAPGAILDLSAYIDFIALDEATQPLLIATTATTTSPTLYHVEIVPAEDGTFAVRITQPDGRVAAKTLEVHRPAVVRKSIPEALSTTIRFATDRPRFGVTPLGTSHGFDPFGDLTCFVIWLNGLGILVDPSPEALDCLDQIGVAETDLPYVWLTHVHADHDGGLIEKLLSGSRTTIIASDAVFRLLIEKARLVTGHDFQRERLVEHLAANPGNPVVLDVAGEPVVLQTRWNMHTIPTNGFTVTMGGKTFGYAGDTQYDPQLLARLYAEHKLNPRQYHDLMYFFWDEDGVPKVDLLYHEAGIPPIHTDKHMLAALSPAVRERTFLVHVADRDVPADFSPPKPQLYGTHVLLPSTTHSCNRTLVHTLGLVSYLYDAPMELLEQLLRRATLKVYTADEMIIRAGQVHYTEPLAFYVIADGEVDVLDAGRVLSTLYKGDSFGEWGISHQRGFRITDVVTRRPTQVLELDEETYHWLVEKHPVVQPRIGKIRDLWPKLQVVRARARQKSAQDPLRTRSVIEEMNSGQLSAFAVFSEVKRYQRWDTAVVEGEEADGLYILLSGHLMVTAAGKTIGELSEADVFGEVGLLEARERTATVRVASADAEILFMSRQNFHTLLHKVPAFSFGVRSVAAQRRAQAPGVKTARKTTRKKR